MDDTPHKILSPLALKRQKAERQTQADRQRLAAQTQQRKLKNESCDKAAVIVPDLQKTTGGQQLAANIERIATAIEIRLCRDPHWTHGALTRPQRRILSNLITTVALSADKHGNTPVNADNVHEWLDLKRPHPNKPGVDMVRLAVGLLFELDYLTTAGLRVDLRHEQRERTITEVSSDGSESVTMKTTAPRTARDFRDWQLTPEFMRELRR